MVQTQFALYQHATTGEVIVRTQGGKDYKINVFGSHTCSFHGNACRLGTHGRRGIFEPCNITAFFDTGACSDPVVTGLHDLGQVVVSDYILRDKEPQTRNFTSNFSHKMDVLYDYEKRGKIKFFFEKTKLLLFLLEPPYPMRQKELKDKRKQNKISYIKAQKAR